jgi:hypothetical protein
MYCIPELADSIFSQEPEVSIQESGESAEMPLAWILDGEILGAGGQNLLKCRHDLDLANIRVVIVVAPPRWFFLCYKGNGLLINMLL